MKLFFNKLNKFIQFRYSCLSFTNRKIESEYLDMKSTNEDNSKNYFEIKNAFLFSSGVDLIKFNDKIQYKVTYNIGFMTKEMFYDFYGKYIKRPMKNNIIIKQNNEVIFYNQKTNKFKYYDFFYLLK